MTQINDEQTMKPQENLEIKDYIFKIDQLREELIRFKKDFETDSKIVAEGVGGLKKYWSQTHFYHALTGAFVSFLTCGFLSVAIYHNSVDRSLRKANLVLTTQKEKNGNVTLSLIGKRIIKANQTDSQVTVEFQK